MDNIWVEISVGGRILNSTKIIIESNVEKKLQEVIIEFNSFKEIQLYRKLLLDLINDDLDSIEFN